MNAIRKTINAITFTFQLATCAAMFAFLVAMVTGWQHNIAAGLGNHDAMTYWWKPFAAMFN